MTTVSVEKLKKVVDRALRDDAYADRLFKDPGAVAAEYGLADAEKTVLKQMSREQFETARKDAAGKAGAHAIATEELASVAGGVALSPHALGTATNMIIGRSVLGATGRSYPKMTAAGCDCCAWKGGVSMGDLVLPPF